MPPESSEMAKYGDAPAFTVSAQKPLKANPRKSIGFNPVMRLGPVFQPYINRTTPAASPEPRTRTPQPSNNLKRSSPAPLTFIEQKPALNPLDQPNKRRRVEEKSPKYKFSNKKTPFSIHRPLKNDQVHKDIWTTILSWSEPAFLLRSKGVCMLWAEILSQQAIWRQARLRQFNTSPPCPDGITEQQYCDLLVGKGCQNSACRRENTSSSNFALLVRLCPECLLAFTTRSQDLPASRTHHIGPDMTLYDCLPQLSLSASHRTEPREVRTDDDDDYVVSSRSSTHRFLRSAYDKLEAEYLQLRDGGAAEQELIAWLKAKKQTTMVQMRQRGEIHRWNLTNHHSRIQAADTRTAREAFFVDKASQLHPPMSRGLLNCFAAWKKALASSNPPTDRSWEVLKSKLLPERPNAELLEQALKRGDRPGTDDIWERLLTHRSGANKLPPELKPEQEWVFNLATQEFRRCVDREVSDADLVLLTLKNTWDRYYSSDKRPRGLNFNGKEGPYQLSMDDCRLILDLVIKKEIPAHSQRGVKVYNRFKCPACIREKERGRLFSFTMCLEHIMSTHSKTVGDTEFWRFALAEGPRRGGYWYRSVPFPWYTLRWPRNLPLHAEHQEPVPWDPDSTRPYVQETVNTTSIFEGRQVNAEVEDVSSFMDFFEHAARKLSGVRLDGQALTRIALQFAIDASKHHEIAEASLEQFVGAVPQIQGINPAMDFRFRCGLCMANGDQKASARHIKHNMPVDSLLLHWRKAHEDEGLGSIRRRDAQDTTAVSRDWKVDFLHLPSDTELFEQVMESDETLEREKETIRAAAAGNNARKRPKAKASLILATPAALDVFDTLFPSDGGTSRGVVV